LSPAAPPAKPTPRRSARGKVMQLLFAVCRPGTSRPTWSRLGSGPTPLILGRSANRPQETLPSGCEPAQAVPGPIDRPILRHAGHRPSLVPDDSQRRRAGEISLTGDADLGSAWRACYPPASRAYR
jgi:hypothetical protein